MKDERVVTVDFMRGLLALGVLFYHTLYFKNVAFIPQIGLHGVYAFFVISGFALYITYRDRLGTTAELRSYFAARFWRIAPLYYTALALSIAIYGHYGQTYLVKLFYNVSFLMGFANPGTTSMVGGGWSIGIETAFYAMFPVIVMACAGSLRRLGLTTLLLLVAQVLFANHVLAGTTLVEAWEAYTQPITFAGYFVGGCLIGEIYRRRRAWKGSPAALLVSAVALMPLVLAPRTAEVIVTGPLGVLLTLATLTLVAGVAFCPEPRGRVKEFAEWLGRISYPVYLLHMIVYHYAAMVPMDIQIPLTFAATLVVADLVNRLIERPALRFSKALASSARELRGERSNKALHPR